MTARMPKSLPPPTMQERVRAARAARALRAAIANPSLMGKHSMMHLDMARPRRGVWLETWENVPGFIRENGRGGTYHHACLPGWEYTRTEVMSEMIPDLEALAERGVRPTVATRAA